jgi:hypothetical protein
MVVTEMEKLKQVMTLVAGVVVKQPQAQPQALQEHLEGMEGMGLHQA